MKKLLLSTVALLVITACSSGGTAMSRLDTKIPTADALEHHNYELVTVNGKAFEPVKGGAAPHIAFGENMQITGAMCNNFFGQAAISKRGVLTAKGVGMTRKFCGDATLNNLDNDIALLLEGGAETIVSQDEQYLRLSNTASSLEFKRVDKIR